MAAAVARRLDHGPKQSHLGNQSQQAAQGAQAAARDAMKNIGGLLGRRNRQEEEPAEEAGPVTQAITMKSLTRIEGVKSGPLSEAMFLPTEGYEEREPEWMRRGGGI